MAKNEEKGMQKILDMLDTDVEINGETPLTNKKFANILRVALKELVKE